MSLVPNGLAAVVASVALAVCSFHASADTSDQVCKTPGPCRTKSIVREADSTKFLLFGSYVFEPSTNWIEHEIFEVSDGKFVRLEYWRADKSIACELSFFTFEGSAQPDLDNTWWIFVGKDVERGRATIVTEEKDKARARRVAIVKGANGETQQIELRQFSVTSRSWMYELTVVGVAPASTSINKNDPEMSACHVRPAAV